MALCYVVTQYYAVGLRKHEMFGSISPQRCSVEIVDLFFPNEAFSIFLVKFLNRMPTGGFHRKKETQTKREANNKVPLPPPPFASNSITPLPLISLR